MPTGTRWLIACLLVFSSASVAFAGPYEGMYGMCDQQTGTRCARWEDESRVTQRVYSATGGALTAAATLAVSGPSAVVAVGAIQGAFPEVTTVTGELLHASNTATGMGSQAAAEANMALVKDLQRVITKAFEKVRSSPVTHRIAQGWRSFATHRYLLH